MENLERNEHDLLPEEDLLSELDDIMPEPDLLPEDDHMVDLVLDDELQDAPVEDDIWDEEFFKILGIDMTLPEAPVEMPEEAEPEVETAVYVDEPPVDPEPKEQPQKKEEDLPWQKSVLLYMHDLAYLLSAVIVVFLLLFRVVVVSGSSMNKTLYNGDYLLLVSNIFYREPEQGDVIVASKDSFKDGAPIVKRVIATEGQTVYIDFERGIVYVDGEPLKEPYVNGKTTMDEGMKFPLTVDEGCVFVLGDNRNDSKDSRDPEIGLIDNREIMGKVVFLFLPGMDSQKHRDFGRIGVVS